MVTVTNNLTGLIFSRVGRRNLSVTDLVLLVLRILRRDLSELAGSIELVDLYNEG